MKMYVRAYFEGFGDYSDWVELSIGDYLPTWPDVQIRFDWGRA